MPLIFWRPCEKSEERESGGPADSTRGPRALPAARRAGYAALGLVLVLFGLLTFGVVLAPNLVLKVAENKRDREEQTLAKLRDGFAEYVKTAQAIPGTSTWASAIASATRLNQTSVEQVHEAFPTDTNTRRVFLIDSNISSLLPYTQNSNGLTSTQTNFIGTSARVMLVSNTKRSLSLPVSSGVPSSTDFNALWNWTYDPASGSPPSGWSSAWSGNGKFLHVQRLNLANLFQRVSLENLQYSLNNSGLKSVSTQTNLYFLRGGMLKVYDSTGGLYQASVVLKDQSVSLTTTSTSSNLYYLTPNGIPTDTDGIPCAQLTNTSPTVTTLPNYDPSRDSYPGLFVKRGGSGTTESDDRAIQKWISSSGSISITGTVSLLIYSAMKEFRTDKGGVIDAYLVECNSSGGSPTTIAKSSFSRSPWDTSGTGTWIQDTLSFGSISRTISSTNRLGVTIIVPSSSDDEMLFAYWTTNYPSRLTITSKLTPSAVSAVSLSVDTIKAAAIAE